MRNDLDVGRPRSRVDGPAKVSGRAHYAGEFFADDMLYGVAVDSAIPSGRIRRINVEAAKAAPGVVEIFTHENRPRTALFNYKHRDEVAPPGSPLRPLHDSKILFSGQPVAFVLADTLERAHYAASLVEVSYESEAHETDLGQAQADGYDPPKKRMGIPPPPKPRGDALAAFAAAPVQVQADFRMPSHHHNPMELAATTVVYEDGRLTIHDKTQGVQNIQAYVANVFGLSTNDFTVLSPFVGGGFGQALRPKFVLYLGVMASLALKRSVRAVATRTQMFALGHRPECRQTVALGATSGGKLTALMHDAVSATSTYEDYQETIVNWSSLLYACDDVAHTYKLAKLAIETPCDMRGPGAVTGVHAIEVAMDELAHATGIDPVQLRLINHADRSIDEDKPFSSKELKACYAAGAAKIGWHRRKQAPRALREGRELVGLGMASGVWEAMMSPTSSRARLSADGRVEIATASADLGTGTYTILSQIAADALGMEIADIDVRLGDSSLPASPPSGGSWTAASAGSSVTLACADLRRRLLEMAQEAQESPLAGLTLGQVRLRDGIMSSRADSDRRIEVAEILRIAGVASVTGEATAKPDPATKMRYASYTHSAVFAEVRVDEDLGIVRVMRVVSAIAAGRIINPKTARSQIVGGVVMGIGMALEEEGVIDHQLGRLMNHSLGDYHVPVNADIRDIDVIFVDEQDDKVSPIGVKGVGEIGLVGTAAAIANAVFNATGKRVRDLPITLDKLM